MLFPLDIVSTPPWAVATAFIVLTLALGLALARLVRGPSLADRVVALDLIAYLLIAFTAVYTIATDRPAFLDVALAIGGFAFLSTVAFARYLERTGDIKEKGAPSG